ncbi:hypothetical protein G3260_006776, partial [Streptomyces albus]|uniref:hypothetical protein n=1 Tax=Streptomyces albus TaxID=1888 RepID=UPI0013B49239
PAATARLLVGPRLLDPAPTRPPLAGQPRDDGARPSREVTLPLIAEHISTWGRVVIDPTLRHADVASLEERSLRYTLKPYGKRPAGPARRRVAFPDGSASGWWRVSDALQEAQSAARRTAADSDGGEADLWWYIALLHLGHARLWQNRIGRTPPQ